MFFQSQKITSDNTRCYSCVSSYIRKSFFNNFQTAKSFHLLSLFVSAILSYLSLWLEDGQLKRERRETEQEKYKVHRAERKWTTAAIRRKTIPSQSLPIPEEDSLPFWRASQLSLPLHSTSASAVKGQVTLQTLGAFHPQLCWLSLLLFPYWAFFIPSHLSLLGQSTVVSSDCWAGRPGELSMPASAVSVTDGPHCHTACPFLLFQPVSFCD